MIVRAMTLAAAILAPFAGPHAAELDGVAMPDTQVVDGTQMWLNGIGLRTFSLLGIRVYVAGLYLQRRSGDADTILHSPQWKLLHIRFLRDVDAPVTREFSIVLLRPSNTTSSSVEDLGAGVWRLEVLGTAGSTQNRWRSKG